MARTSHSFAPPVMAARHWLDGVQFTAERPLLNLSPAAPVGAPPEGLRAAIADAPTQIVAFANVDRAGIASLTDRLAALDGPGWPLAPKAASA